MSSPDQLRRGRTNRRGYIDWLRGLSVLIMIEAHTLDAWTRLDGRQNSVYGWAMIVGGVAAPGGLLLAGLAGVAVCL